MSIFYQNCTSMSMSSAVLQTINVFLCITLYVRSQWQDLKHSSMTIRIDIERTFYNIGRREKKTISSKSMDKRTTKTKFS